MKCIEILVIKNMESKECSRKLIKESCYKITLFECSPSKLLDTYKLMFSNKMFYVTLTVAVKIFIIGLITYKNSYHNEEQFKSS